VEFDTERVVSGVALVNDRADRIPDDLVVQVATAGGGLRQVAALEPQGVAASWENGAIRITPSRTLMVRFDPVMIRRIRLCDRGRRPGGWSVGELFLPGAPPAGGAPDTTQALVTDGRRLEAAGQPGSALARYHEAMGAGPDDPAGYAALARLITLLR